MNGCCRALTADRQMCVSRWNLEARDAAISAVVAKEHGWEYDL